MESNATTTHLAAELAQQPTDWEGAVDRAAQHQAMLPISGERVAVIGCGTSLFMAQAYARLRESRGAGLTDAWTPGEARLERDYDRVLAITRSGTTTEVIGLLNELGGRIPATVITATADSPVAEFADAIVTPELDEQSVVQTRFATGTLAMLRAHLGEDLSTAIEQAKQVLAAPDAHFGQLLDAEQITVLGHDWSVGLAQEAALKLRESAQLWTEAYSMLEYRHGPMSISAPNRVVWTMGDLVPHLVDDIERTGAHAEVSVLDPMAELVRVHRLSLLRALSQGLNPDSPRNLTRSIIIPA